MIPKPTKQILFTPGPVLVKQEVLDALSKQVVFHRTKGFEETFDRCINRLQKIFGGNSKYQPIVLTGSGTMANEASLISVFNKQDRILILSNGHFGERLFTIAKLHKLKTLLLKKEWGESFSIEEIKDAVIKQRSTGICMVALETSTGMVNPVRKIGELCKSKGIVFFVDAVSALGAERVHVVKDHIDVCTSVPNKALEAPPGTSFVCVKKNVLNRNSSRPSSFYSDLKRYVESAKFSQTPTTPAVNLFSALNVALRNYLKERSEHIGRYRTFSKLVREKAEKLGLHQFIEDPKSRATAITTLSFESGETTKKLQSYLLDKGYTLWRQEHQTERGEVLHLMQISVMGEITKSDVEKLFTHIARFFQTNV